MYLQAALKHLEDAGQSEAHAIAECISDALESVPPSERFDHAIAMANEFIGWAQNLKTTLVIGWAQHVNRTLTASQKPGATERDEQGSYKIPNVGEFPVE